MLKTHFSIRYSGDHNHFALDYKAQPVEIMKNKDYNVINIVKDWIGHDVKWTLDSESINEHIVCLLSEEEAW